MRIKRWSGGQWLPKTASGNWASKIGGGPNGHRKIQGKIIGWGGGGIGMQDLGLQAALLSIKGYGEVHTLCSVGLSIGGSPHIMPL